MKTLLVLFTLAFSSVLLVAQDGYALSRELQDSYSLDSAVKEGSDVFVARCLSSHPANSPTPLNASPYQGDVELLYRLHGQCPSILNCTFLVFYDATKQIPRTSRQEFTPKVGKTYLLMGTYYPELKQLQVRRFIEPTPENLKLAGSLIREYKAEELAASPEAVKRLDQGLAAALQDAVQREKPPAAPAKATQKSHAPSAIPMVAKAVLALAVLAIAVVLWKRRSRVS